jgi:hypothetical protein
MEPTLKLTPQEGCSLAAVLFPEEFKTNRARAIVRAIMWLTEATDAPGESTSFIKPARDGRIERLDRIVAERGMEDVAKQIGASMSSVKAWLRGAPPNSASLEKIERFLANSAPAATAKPPVQTGELFTRPEPALVEQLPPATPEAAS